MQAKLTQVEALVTQINYVSRNQLHSTEFLLSTLEFERQNFAGCCKQTFCVQFSSKAKHNFFQFSQWPTEWAQKFKFLQNSFRVK